MATADDMKPSGPDDETLLMEARERLKECEEYESEERERMQEDNRFEAGDQWPGDVKRARENDPNNPRPCLTVNRARKHHKNLVNDMRENKPQIKVLPVDDKADVETANMLNGRIRHIQVTSDAGVHYAMAAGWQTKIGVGYFRIYTFMQDAERNHQDLAIGGIRDPFSVYMDIDAEHPAGADQTWCIVLHAWRRSRVKAVYPDAELVDFERVPSDLQRWYPSADRIVFGEYWCATEVRHNMVMLPDGRKATEADYLAKYADREDKPEARPAGEIRFKRAHCAYMLGNQVLDKKMFPSRYIPIIRVTGEERWVDGVRERRGMIHDIKDPCRMYNYWCSLNTEMIALAPKSPYIGPAEAFEGYESEWAEANTANKAYLPYNQWDEQGNRLDMPKRADPIAANTALIQAMIQSASDIEESAGQSGPVFGEPSREKSGVALREQKQAAGQTNYDFADNLNYAVKHAGRVIIDAMPILNDTRRQVPIMNEDESVEFAQLQPNLGRSFENRVNAMGGNTKVYDLTVGKYDVVASVGPSYATQRQEALEGMADMLNANPQLWPVIGHIVAKKMDWPGADEIAEILEAVAPPEVKAVIEARQQGRDEAAMMFEKAKNEIMARVGPMVQEMEQALREAGAEIEDRDKRIQVLEVKLASKLKDIDAELRKAEMDDETKRWVEAVRADAGIVEAVIRAGGKPPPSAGETVETLDVDAMTEGE